MERHSQKGENIPTLSEITEVLNDKISDLFGIVLIVLDASGKIVYMGRKAQQKLACGHFDFEELVIDRVFADPKCIELKSAIKDILNGTTAKKIVVIEDRTESGEIKAMRWTVRRIGEEKKVVGAVVIGEEYEEYTELAKVFHDLPVGIVFADMDDNILMCNFAFGKMLDVAPDEIKGRNFLDFVSKEDIPKVREETELRKRGITSKYNVRLVTNKGEKKILEVHAIPQKNQSGHIHGFVGVFLDVTKEVLAKNKLKAEQKKLDVITRASKDGIVIVDEEMRIVFWNDAVESLFGYSKEELKDLTIDLMVSPNQRESFRKEFRKAVKTRTLKHPNAELIGLRSNGDKFPIEISIDIIEQEKHLHFVIVLRDTTERKHNEAIREMQRKELELYASLLRHDIRNDIETILWNVDLLRSLETNQKELLDEITQSIEALCERINFVVSAFGKPSKSPERDLVHIIREVVSKAKAANPKLRALIKLDKNIDKITIMGSSLLPMVLENLIRNSEKYAGSDTTITIMIRKINRSAEIIFSDDGPGIPEDLKRNLFQKGVTTSGTGLGLYLSREILKTLGGKIELMESGKKEGAVFRIELPLAH